MRFPSGKIEMLEEDYETLEQAIEGGNKMVLQVQANEPFFSEGNTHGKGKPYFFVLRVVGKNKDEIYDSREY